jgi:hypothetical protein
MAGPASVHGGAEATRDGAADGNGVIDKVKDTVEKLT